MKTIATILIGLALCVSASAEVVKVPTSTPDVTVTLNTDTLVVEGGYRGYTVRTEFNTPGPLNLADQTINVKAVNTVFEVDCATNAGRARRFSLEDATGQLHEADRIWRTIDHPPATDTIAFIKTLACK